MPTVAAIMLSSRARVWRFTLPSFRRNVNSKRSGQDAWGWHDDRPHEGRASSRPRRLDAVRRDIAANIFARGMVHALPIKEQPTQTHIAAVFVGVQRGAGFDCLWTARWIAVAVLTSLTCFPTRPPLSRIPKTGGFSNGAAPAFQSLRFVLFAVLPADIGFVVSTIPRRVSGSVPQASRRRCRTNHADFCVMPISEKLRLVEMPLRPSSADTWRTATCSAGHGTPRNRTGANGERGQAGVAPLCPAGALIDTLGFATGGADRAIGPASRFHVSRAVSASGNIWNSCSREIVDLLMHHTQSCHQDCPPQ